MISFNVVSDSQVTPQSTVGHLYSKLVDGVSVNLNYTTTLTMIGSNSRHLRYQLPCTLVGDELRVVAKKMGTLIKVHPLWSIWR